MNLNVKASDQNTYDAIVVGSGISGGWAAKELCEKGLKVLMLERGKNLVHPNYPTATLDPWDIPNAGKLTQEDTQRCHIQARHYSYRGDNKDFYINDLENPSSEAKRFDWSRGDIVGGRSGAYENSLRDARQTALAELAAEARTLGADGVIGIDLDYEVLGKEGSMLMVTASGTAVKLG